MLKLLICFIEFYNYKNNSLSVITEYYRKCLYPSIKYDIKSYFFKRFVVKLKQFLENLL